MTENPLEEKNNWLEANNASLQKDNEELYYKNKYLESIKFIGPDRWYKFFMGLLIITSVGFFIELILTILGFLH